MWWLEFPDGVRRRLDGRGVVLGRRSDCDVVIDDRQVSSIQAIVLVGHDGPELRSVGRNPTLVSGVATTVRKLAAGDRIEFPGLTLTVGTDGESGGRWVARVRGRRFGVRGRLRIGGGRDDVVVPGWREHALVLVEAQGSLVLEVSQQVTVAGETFEPGWVEVLESGDELAIAGEHVGIDVAGGETGATLLAAHLPIQVAFSFLPTGARLELGFARQTPVSVELPELRARLVALLLRTPGEFVDDETLLRGIWPGQADRGRTDINTLVHRCRKDLVRGGVNPGPILVRARGGGGAAFHVARGAVVST
ncbi:MAG: FHA domain-containing protein [Proteobacteria bacterium]|nr:FHA domain-containing protein [Pseudomonadota bacterium]MCP4918160.1 FHA domain-containing protein [Pseudomonadota bacterium]